MDEPEAMLEGGDVLLVNTHIPFEGDIPGTDVSIPYNDIPGHLELLPKDKSATIVVYCMTGPMSRAAARELVSMGYTAVHDLVGGMADWVGAGNELVDR